MPTVIDDKKLIGTLARFFSILAAIFTLIMLYLVLGVKNCEGREITRHYEVISTDEMIYQNQQQNYQQELLRQEREEQRILKDQLRLEQRQERNDFYDKLRLEDQYE